MRKAKLNSGPWKVSKAGLSLWMLIYIVSLVPYSSWIVRVCLSNVSNVGSKPVEAAEKDKCRCYPIVLMKESSLLRYSIYSGRKGCKSAITHRRLDAFQARCLGALLFGTFHIINCSIIPSAAGYWQPNENWRFSIYLWFLLDSSSLHHWLYPYLKRYTYTKSPLPKFSVEIQVDFL